MNYGNLKKIIEKFSKHCELMQKQNQEVQDRFAVESKRLNAKYFAQFKQDINGQVDAHYRPQYDALCAELNKELDTLRDGLLSEIKSNRPADYEQKLSNVLSMIDALDERGLSQSLDSLKENIRPFSYDGLAKSAISTKISKKGVMAFDLFDEETPLMLEKLETAREFTNRYNDAYLPSDMMSYFSRNFEGFDGDLGEKPFPGGEFNFNFQNIKSGSIEA